MSKVYKIVQERIIKDIEEAMETGGVAPWVKPWTSNCIPKNYITKKPYKGINLLLLSQGGYYITLKQLTDLKKKYDFLNLKKGSKAEIVVFWTYKDTKDNKETDTESEEESICKKTPIFRYYNVFHESCIDNFSMLPDIEKKNIVLEEIIEPEELIKEYSKIVPIEYKNTDKACYIPALDKIIIPTRESFHEIESYYKTIFHEMTHSTGNKNRLNRLAENFTFGDHNYSKEELVAEIGASMLSTEFNIENARTIENSKSYLYGWLKAIKEDITLITYAAQKAQKSCDYIIENTNIYNKTKVS